MVSTQNSYLPNNGFPAILGTKAHATTDSVERVLVSPLTSTPSSLETSKVHHLVENVNAASAAVLTDLSYNGNQPKSIAHLLAMGAKRNISANTANGVDEVAAFHNDREYYKVLLAAREKHRAAMRAKLNDLRILRAKQRKMYRKRQPEKPTSPALAAALAHAVANSNIAMANNISRGEKWRTLPGHPVCASPVSTDVESEVTSDFGDPEICDDKPIVFRA